MKENRKIVIERLGTSFRDCTRIVSEPVRAPAEGEILIRHRLAGVNGVYDQMMCANQVLHTPVEPPADTGVEAAGVVAETGPGVSDLRVGDAVITVGAGGGYRLWKTCAADAAIPVPDISRELVALIPSGVSALLALEVTGEMGSGEIVCITAAAGGLGNIATQLAVLAGNHVVAVCGSREKADWLRSVGAARVIDYREESLADVLKAEYPEKIDLALDSVGGPVFDALAEQLAPHGRLVVCGATADRLPPERVTRERIYHRLYWKAASVRGFMNWRFADHFPAARKKLLDLLHAGRLQPLVDPTPFVGLESVADAVDYLLAGRNLGKVLVDLSGDPPA